MRAFQIKTKEKLEIISGETILEAMQFYAKKESIDIRSFQNGTKITEIHHDLWDSVLSFNFDAEGERDWVNLTELMEDVTEPQLITTGNYKEQ